MFIWIWKAGKGKEPLEKKKERRIGIEDRSILTRFVVLGTCLSQATDQR